MDKLRDFLHSWPGRILMLLCMSPMLFMGLDSYFSGGGLQADEVAKVGDTPVQLTALQREVNEARTTLLTQVDSSQIDEHALNAQTLENMINRSLLTEQAKALGMALSDEAITLMLSREAAFLDENGKFSNDKFAQFLQMNGLTKDRLFAIQRQELNVRGLMNGILLSAIYPNTQISRLIDLQSQSRPLWIKRLAWQNYSQKVSVSDGEITAYYNEHKESLISPEMVDLSYLEITPAAVQESVASDEELKAAYQDYLRQNGVGQKQLAQILLTGDNVKKLAELQQKLKNGTPFEELAKTYSDDPTGKTGGNIGAYNPAVFGADSGKVDTAIAALKVGEVSEPVVTSFGTQIFKVVGAEEAPSFESLKTSLTATVIRQKNNAKFNELVAKINNMAVDGFALKDIGDELKLPVKKIDNYKAVGQEIMGQPAIVKEAFDEMNLQDGSVSKGIEVAGSTIWVQSTNHRPKAAMTAETAKPVIKEILTKQKAIKLALEDAKTIAKGEIDVAKFDKAGVVTRQSAILTPAEQSSLFVNEANGDKPVAWAVETAIGASVLVGGKIETKSVSQMSDAQKAQTGAMMKMIVGQDHLEDYLEYLKTVHKVQMNEELLKTL